MRHVADRGVSRAHTGRFDRRRNPAGDKNKTQSMDQRRFVEASYARFHTITSTDNMAEEIAEAFYAARVHRVPVVLNLPMNLQEETIDWDYDYQPPTRIPATADRNARPGSAGAGDRETRCCGTSGYHCRARRSRRAPRTQSSNWPTSVGALLATSLQGKGYFAGHPWDIGIAGAFASAPSEQLLAEADFVLGVGAELGYYTTEGGLLFPSAEVARIDIKPMPEEIGVIPGLYVQGDGRKSVTALNEALASRQVRRTGLRTGGDEGGARCSATSIRYAC